MVFKSLVYYAVGNGLMVYRLENVPTAVQKEAKLLMFHDVQGFDNLSCLDRVSRAQMSSKRHHYITLPMVTDRL